MFGLFNHFHNTVIKMTIIRHDVIPVCQIEESSGKSSISDDAHLAPMMSFFARSIPAMTLTLSTLVSCCQKKKSGLFQIMKGSVNSKHFSLLTSVFLWHELWSRKEVSKIWFQRAALPKYTTYYGKGTYAMRVYLIASKNSFIPLVKFLQCVIQHMQKQC